MTLEYLIYFPKYRRIPRRIVAKDFRELQMLIEREVHEAGEPFDWIIRI